MTTAATLLLSLGMFVASAPVTAGVLNDSDIPTLREALKKSYTPELCQNDLPGASTQTCECLGKAMADNLNADNLKLCQKDGYDECVAKEFTSAKSALTDKQIADCKALTKNETPTSVQSPATTSASDGTSKTTGTDNSANDNSSAD